MNGDSDYSDTQRWKHYGYLAIGILVLIIIVWQIKNRIDGINNENNSQNPTDNIVVPNIVRAEPKKVADGFPKELILNSQTEINGSYSATYPNSSVKQATVEFVSSKSQKENYDFYRKWATDNQWEIINSLDSGPVWSLYLRKANEDINLTFSAGSINISYSKLSP